MADFELREVTAIKGLGINQKNMLGKLVRLGPQKCTRGKTDRRVVLESLVKRGLATVADTGVELVFSLTIEGRRTGEDWLALRA